MANPDSQIYSFFNANDKYFNTGFVVTFYVKSDDTDFTSKETQLKMIEFN